MKQFIITLFAVLALSVSARATDVTVSSQTVPGFSVPNLGQSVTLTATVTNGSATMTSSAAFRTQWVGLGGFTIAINGTNYTVSYVTSTSSLTLTSNYVGTSGATTVTWYPYVLARLYSSIQFYPGGSSTPILPGAPGSGPTFRQYAASVLNVAGIDTLYLPQMVIPATTDGTPSNTARITVAFHRPEGALIGGPSQFFTCASGVSQYRIPTTTPTSWKDICAYNAASQVVLPTTYYTAAEIDGREPSCTANQIIYNAATGRTRACLTVGSGLQISGATLSTIAGTNITSIREAVNVKRDYSCVGDGVTNDTSCILSAITAAQGSGKELYFPAGTYLTDTITQNLSNLVIVGDSYKNSILKARNANTPVINVTGANYAVDLVIQDLGFVGQGATSGSSGHCIVINDTDPSGSGLAQATLRNVHISQCGGKGLYVPRMFNVLLDSVVVDHVGGNGFELHGSNTTTLIRTYVKTLDGANTAAYRIYAGTPTLIGANGIDSCPNGGCDWGVMGRTLADDGVDSYVRLNCTNCNIEDFKNRGIYFKYYSSGNFFNTVFYAPTTGTVRALKYDYVDESIQGIFDGQSSIVTQGASWTNGYPIHSNAAPFHSFSVTSSPYNTFWNGTDAQIMPQWGYSFESGIGQYFSRSTGLAADKLKIGGGGIPSGYQSYFRSTTTGNIGLAVTQAVGQTARPFQVENATSSVILGVNTDGSLASNANGALAFVVKDTSGNALLRAARANTWADVVASSFLQLGGSSESGWISGVNAATLPRLGITATKTQITDTDTGSAPAPGSNLLGLYKTTSGNVAFEIKTSTVQTGDIISYHNSSAVKFKVDASGYATTERLRLSNVAGDPSSPSNGDIAYNSTAGKFRCYEAGAWANCIGGGGSGSGTVTSVAQSFTGGLISVAGSPVTTSGTLALTVAGTSGGIPYFSSASTWASSAALAANALVIGGGAGAAPATTTTGTGVLTALGVNTGSAGAFVVNGGALGTPSSGTLTNATGLPLTSGVTGVLPVANGGTNASSASITAFNNITGYSAAGATGTTSTNLVFSTSPTLVTPNLGTPSAVTLTNATGLPVSTGISGLGTGVATFLATPSSANLASAITDETGSGAAVFGTAPTLSLPVIDNPKHGYTTTATAAGTTTLTSASNLNQFFTGTTTQTVVLPAVSGLTLGEQYIITNNSTGIVTVQSSGANTILAMPGGTTATYTVILTSGTGTASWSASYTGNTGITGTGSFVLATSPTLVTPALGTPSSATLTNATGLPLSTGVTGTLQAAQFPALTGDVTTSAGSLTTAIGSNKVTNAMLATIATATFKGRTTAGTGNVEDLTATQATALLNAMVGDSGSGGTKGLVPAPAAGDSGKCLSGAGTYIACSGGSGAPTSAQYVTLATDATLTAERVLTGTTNQITLTDGGAGGNITLSTPQDIATSSTPQFARLGLGAAAAATSIIKVTGPTLTTEATNTIAVADLAATFSKNDTNVRTHYGWQFSPTVSPGASNSNYTVNLVAITPTLNANASNTAATVNVLYANTTNTSTTNVTTNLVNLNYGNSQKFLIDSSGNTTIGGTLNMAGQLTNTFSSSGNAGILTQNTNTGTAATSEIDINNSTNYVRLGVTSTGFTTGTYSANEFFMESNGLTNGFAFNAETSSKIRFMFGNTEMARVVSTGIRLGTNALLGGSGFTSADAFWRRGGAATWVAGDADAASAVAQTFTVQSVGAGNTDTAGANWTFSGSKGTGTGAGGSILFKTAPAAGSTGSSQNALVTRMTIDSTGLVTLGASGTLGSLAFGNATSGTVTIQPVTGALGSVTMSIPAATDTFVGKATTDTLTNKTLDAEGTGNTLTLPFKTSLPAAGCNNATAGTIWDLPTSNAPTAACVTGTNIQKGVLQFGDSANQTAQTHFMLPDDWSGNVDIKLTFTSTDTTNAHTTKFTVATACRTPTGGSGSTDDPTFNTAQTLTYTNGASEVSAALRKVTQTSVTMTGCSAGDLFHLKVGRDTTDTDTTTINFVMAEVTLRRAM